MGLKYEKIKLQKLSTSSEKIIEIDVGGTKMKILTSLIKKVPKSNLSKVLLSGNVKTKKNKSNVVFIDRNAKTFSHVIEYLRNDF